MILLICCLFGLAYNQIAVLMSSAVGYYNYRQTAGVMSIYQTLRELGFHDADILLAIPENTGCS